jgi:8-oxo-dGTP pyrophosphatase MutT (NUDIX family)
MEAEARSLLLLETLRTHAPEDGRERESLEKIVRFIESTEDPFSRSTARGHVTGSAVVARPDGSAFLLVRHRKLERWLQPGGHADPGDRTVLETALREAREETGCGDLAPACGGRPIDVDVHSIPARAGEPAHLHFDVRYLLTGSERAGGGELAEVDGVAWFTLEEAIARGIDESLERTLRKAETLLRRGKRDRSMPLQEQESGRRSVPERET